jgi:putative FmdB family regulatory protein
MPFYDYHCERCGSFRDWRPMSDWAADVPCPECSSPAPRLVASPMLRVLAQNNRIAHERNERSAHEPQVVRREDLPGNRHHADHQHVSPLIRQQFGRVGSSPGHRSWMVGH